MLHKQAIWSYFLLLFTFMHSYSQSQPPSFNADAWHQNLSSKKDTGYTSTFKLFRLIFANDSPYIANALAALESKNETSNLYYKARVACFKSNIKILYNNYTLKEISAITEEAINQAYETRDERFIAFIHWLCGSIMINIQQLAPAVSYKLRAEEIYSKLGYLDYNYYRNWAALGELLFHVRDYEQCIDYSKKAIYHWEQETDSSAYLTVRYYNTIAQAYEQLNKMDSAMLYLDTSYMLAEKGHYENWKAINAGFKGQLLFKMNQYNEAKPLLEYDYAFTSKRENPDVAAKSLQWLARINLIEGKKRQCIIKEQRGC